MPLRTITLPQRLVQAIEDKMRQEQEHERMQFVLMKERAEAERKEIEAAGIAQFQKVVSEGISKELLQWKGIEATEKLAESTNSKVVIMGNTKDSLPVILGGESSAAPAPVTAAPAAARAAAKEPAVLSSTATRTAQQ